MHDFFHRYRVVVSCVFFLGLALMLRAMNTLAPGRVDPVGVLLLEVMHPLQLGMTAVSRGATRVWDEYIALWSLREQNEELRRRLADMEDLSRRALELDLANRRLGKLLDLKATWAGSAIAAHIVGRSPSSVVRTVVLDKGEANGVAKGMAVLAPDGVVGQVIAVSAHAARVMLVSDPNSGIDVLVQRSRVQGIAAGSVENGCSLKYIQRGSDVAVGDTIITSGLDGIFPKGQPVGTVTRVDARENRMFQEVEVKLSADLAKIEEVLVVPPAVVRAGE
ncbi:MAG TPA: rod shape-determining protein MreC [Methylomirabilota bacterium]|nr:rod shape-determining protein MreC [Methylomirabilota bacterium]